MSRLVNHSKNRSKRPLLPIFFSLIILTSLMLGLWIFVPSALAQPLDTTKVNSGSSQTEATPSQIADDDYYSSLFAHSWEIPEEAAGVNTFWIEVDLTNQMLFAYRGDKILNAFIVSTGASPTETVTGTFKIYAKYNKYNMTGPDYEYPDVPYTMFFHKGYSIHGTYWHNFFGVPMSWGCVNMKTDEAAWIYENAPVGTYVFIHY